jgi:hypothetical protein
VHRVHRSARHRSFLVVGWAALVLVAVLAVGACQDKPARPAAVTGPTPEQVRAFCDGAKAPAPTTAEGYRLLMVDLRVAGDQPVTPTALQVRFSQASEPFLDAVQQELSYLQGRTGGRSKPTLDRAFEQARQTLLATCQALPASLLAGTPLPVPSTQKSLDGYCAVADLPHDTPDQLAALRAAAEVTAPFKDTTRNRAISHALNVVSSAALYATQQAKLPAELRHRSASAPPSTLPLTDLPAALAALREACR